MTGIINLISSELTAVNFSSPLAWVDLILAIGLVVATLMYLRKFPIFRVVLGVVFLYLCAVVFFLFGFIYTALIFGIVSNLILISLPLIFAPEIRHYLEKIGRFPFLKFPAITSSARRTQFIRNLSDSVYDLAKDKTGALIVIQRKTGLGETIETGVVLDARFGGRLLSALFYPKSPLHDGAVVLRNFRIYAAGCLLPVNSGIRLPSKMGLRHRAGISITQDTDALVIIVSEQRGQVSLAENGKLRENLNKSELASYLVNKL
jgi:diadenylate cyclase